MTTRSDGTITIDVKVGGGYLVTPSRSLPAPVFPNFFGQLASAKTLARPYFPRFGT